MSGRAPVSAPKAPIGWYGGKAHLAERIAGMLPAHHTYVEAFGGAASLLFAKRRATLEVYNDIDSGLVTFFRCLRDQPEQLARLLRFTPYAREEFTVCRRNLGEHRGRPRAGTPLVRADAPSVRLLGLQELGP